MIIDRIRRHLTNILDMFLDFYKIFREICFKLIHVNQTQKEIVVNQSLIYWHVILFSFFIENQLKIYLLHKESKK